MLLCILVNALMAFQAGFLQFAWREINRCRGAAGGGVAAWPQAVAGCEVPCLIWFCRQSFVRRCYLSSGQPGPSCSTLDLVSDLCVVIKCRCGCFVVAMCCSNHLKLFCHEWTVSGWLVGCQHRLDWLARYSAPASIHPAYLTASSGW